MYILIETVQNDVWLSQQAAGGEKTTSFGNGTLCINEDALQSLLAISSTEVLAKRPGMTKKSKKRLHQKPATCGYGSCVSFIIFVLLVVT